MPIRIGLKTQYDRMLYHLNRLTTDLSDLQAQAASGIKFDKPSDAPVDLVSTLKYRKAIEEIDRYQKSIQEAESYLQALDKSYEALEDIVIRAKELALQGANDTLNSQDRVAISEEIWNLLEEAISIANSKQNGRYIFAGNKPIGYENGPFEMEKTPLPNGDILIKISYLGGKEDLYQGYSFNQKVLVGKNGEEALQKSGIFETLVNLYRTLRNNNEADTVKETKDIDNALENLNKTLLYLTKEHADIGAKLNHMELKKNLYEDLKMSIQENLSKTQDVDLLKVASEIKSKETAYQAALAASAKVMQMSLVNFLS